MTETWKPINGYENYEVSDSGNVRNTKTGKVLKNNVLNRGNGYHYVIIYANSKPKHMLIHRAVASAFLENPSDKTEVDHIDRNPKNNHISNLRWASHAENMRNMSIRSDNASGTPGISFSEEKQKWRVRIQGKHIGYYTDLEDAKTAREYAMTQHFGSFAPVYNISNSANITINN